jgi:copper transport protein
MALLAIIGTPGIASAHAVLLDETPANGQLLTSTPPEVSMRFSESVDLGLANIRLIDARGNDVTGLPAPTHPAGSRAMVSLAIPTALANGTYTVAWRVISADTHPVQGAFTFSVGTVSGSAARVPSSGGSDSPLGWLYGLTRWLAYAGFAVLVGTAWFVAFCWPGGAAGRAVRRLLRGGWGVLLGATVLELLVYGPYADGQSIGGVVNPTLLGRTLGSTLGGTLLLRVALLAAVAVGGVLFLRRHGEPPDAEPNRARRAAVVLGAAPALAVTWSLATHSAVDREAALALPVDVVHLVAMGVWIGGLPVLLGVLLRSGGPVAMRLAVPRFSTTAGIAVAVLVATGLYQSWRQVGISPAALFGTAYGVLLLAKVAVVAVLVGFGGLARRWTHRHYGFAVVTVSDKRRAKRVPATAETSGFRRMIAAESALAVVLLGLTAALVTTEPARAAVDTKAVAAAQTATITGPLNETLPFDTGGRGGRGQVNIEVVPGKVGPNEVHLQVLDPSGNYHAVAEVRAAFTLPARSLGPLPVTLITDGSGHYASNPFALPIPGKWELALTVRTSDVDETTLRIPVGVG